MAKFEPKVILLTGGAGFIGANFIHYFTARYQDVHVVNLDKLTYAGSLDRLGSLSASSHYTFIEGDICDDKLVHDLLRKYEINTVIHFAAESHVDRSIVTPKAFIDTNVVGTFTLLNETGEYWLNECGFAADECRFHHISTDEVYGSLGIEAAAFTESSAYAPNSPYSASKAGADHLVRASYHTYGLPVITTNCSNNYGPWQHDEKFIPTVIRACIQQTDIPVYGDGSNIRDWIYVDDHCKGLDLVLREGQSGETYNLGGNSELSNIEVVKLICEAFDLRYPDKSGHEALISFVEDRPGHDWRYAIDNTKIANELGFSPEVSFKSGLSKTIDWYIEHYK